MDGWMDDNMKEEAGKLGCKEVRERKKQTHKEARIYPLQRINLND